MTTTPTPKEKAPWTLRLSVLFWAVPGAWSGLSNLILSFFMPAEIINSGWFGSAVIPLLALYTLVTMGVPALLLCKARTVRIIFTLIAMLFTVSVFASPSPEFIWTYPPVLVGSILMWLPSANRYMQKPVRRDFGAII